MTEVKQNHIVFSILLTLAVVLSGCKKEFNETVTVERDCTGTYLRLGGKDHQVCNLEKVASFADGVTVKARFKKLRECNGSARDAIVCAMIHPNEGWIEVSSIE